MAKLIIEKVLSGRFILTVLFGFTTCYCVIKGRIPAEAFTTLAGVVVHGYFTRDRSEDKKGGVNGTGTGTV